MHHPPPLPVGQEQGSCTQRIPYRLEKIAPRSCLAAAAGSRQESIDKESSGDFLQRILPASIKMMRSRRFSSSAYRVEEL